MDIWKQTQAHMECTYFHSSRLNADFASIPNYWKKDRKSYDKVDLTPLPITATLRATIVQRTQNSDSFLCKLDVFFPDAKMANVVSITARI